MNISLLKKWWKNRLLCQERENGTLKLKNDHAYYYQMQLQHCDFVVWKEEDMFVQRIPIDMEFIDDTIENVQLFIKLAILPKLVGKWFTRQNVAPLSKVTKDQLNSNKTCSSTEVWCYCQRGKVMVI